MQNIPIHLRSSTFRQIGLIIDVIWLDGDDIVVCVGFEEAEEVGQLFEAEVWLLALVAVLHCLLYVSIYHFIYNRISKFQMVWNIENEG